MKKILQILFFVAIIPSLAMAQTINKIQITGNQRIEQSTILEYASIKVGDTYSEYIKHKAIKSLYATLLFETIEFNFDRGVLNVQVHETPFVSKIIFNGNYKVKTALLAKSIDTTPGESLVQSQLRRDIEKIKSLYKRSGRFAVRVDTKIEKQDQNRVHVVFNIVEGPKTGIKKIYFAGNDHYKDNELKSVILTKESRWFRFLESNDVYDPDRIEFDKFLIQNFYNSVGFADFRIISVTADLLPNKEGFVLTYSMDEGAKYKFGKIKCENKIPAIDLTPILKFIPQKTNAIYDINIINSAVNKIKQYLSNKGYPNAFVSNDINIDKSRNIVDVTIVIQEASKIFINKINITGNLKTEDGVIRHHVHIEENDIFNRTTIDKAERNISNLDYFEKMILDIAPTAKQDRYNINISVKEKSTASLGFDLGYNTAGGPFGKISLLERNLIGKGQYLNAGIQIGKSSLYYNLGLTNPYFLGKDLSVGAHIVRSEQGAGSGFENGKQHYSSKVTTGKLLFGYQISEDASHNIEYALKNSYLSADKKSQSIFIKEQLGQYTTSLLNHSLTYDRLDSAILPKNGYMITGTQEFAGLGGKTKYLKHEINARFFKSFIDNKYTLKFTTSAGHIKGLSNKNIRISDRFNLGDATLRGFAPSGVGPRDKTSNESLGGQNYYTISSELNFPLGLPKELDVTGAIFCDAGDLWGVDSKALSKEGLFNDRSMRYSVGVGVLWITRIAPIRLDFAIPLKKKKYDETQRFHIRFSTHF